MKNRHINIPGLVNFRDLGGYPAHTRQPGTIRKGMLFRSGQLHETSDDALQHLQKLNVGLVVDFRTDREREKRPSRLPGNTRNLLLPMNPGSAGGFADIVNNHIAKGKPVEAEQIKAAMEEVYTSLVLDHANSYANFIKHLLEHQPAVTVFHCASGKDRTGIAAALLLALLGCDRNTILDDYLLTNYILDADHQRERAISDFGQNITSLLDEEAIAALYGVQDSYLQAAFDTIEQHWGSLDGWISNALGITGAEQEQLQAHFLE
jgi:protein-tyrosine phosphatase